MNLYLWHGDINGSRYTIFSLANDLNEAEGLAIESASKLSQEHIKRILRESKPIINDSPTSFIFGSAPQLI